MPKKVKPKVKNILPVKCIKQYVESYDAMTESLKYCIEPSEHTEINAMTQLKVKSQRLKQNMSQTLNSQIYHCITNTDLHRPEDITPPTYEVRMKNAHHKKHEKYDKLTSKAF